MEKQADIGLIGLAVMGRNLALNMADHGHRVAVFNRTTALTEEFLAGPARGRSEILAARSLEELVGRLARPRRVMLMVKAGRAVDEVIEALLPLLERGDLLIDGGNSHFPDTERRARALEEKGLLYIGAGISGGEEGARRGPSIMPGGSPAAWPLVKGIFQSIAARAPDGTPCCEWIGPGGAGHYVKMIHNGIEYGDMQLIGESYWLLRELLGLDAGRMREVYADWNRGELDSYLIAITADILAVRDADGAPLVDKILDAAGQKGTGKWTGINSLELGIPATLITEAVYARSLSALKEERVAASRLLAGPAPGFGADRQALTEDIRQALYAAKIVCYAQGFLLMREAAREYGWNLKPGEIASIWRGGCIIRSAFLHSIKAAYERDPDLPNLLLDAYFRQAIDRCQPAWRRVVAAAALGGLPAPALSAALAFYDGYRSARLPANLLQAQRDYFGAHRYERVDRPRGELFHSDWAGLAGLGGGEGRRGAAGRAPPRGKGTG